SERVGRLWGVRKALTGGRSYYRLRFRLSGQIGGMGGIRVRGSFGGHDHRLRVVGGKHDFHDVVGHLDVGEGDLAHFSLTLPDIEAPGRQWMSELTRRVKAFLTALGVAGMVAVSSAYAAVTPIP